MTQPKHPTKNTICEINERKWKHAYCKIVRPRHPGRDTTRKSKHTHCKIICPRHPARNSTQWKKCKCQKWKHTRRNRSGQSIQQKTPSGRHMKRNNVDPVQNHPANASNSKDHVGDKGWTHTHTHTHTHTSAISSEANIWETHGRNESSNNGNWSYQTTCKQSCLGNRHGESSGRYIKRHVSKPEAKWSGQAIEQVKNVGDK